MQSKYSIFDLKTLPKLPKGFKIKYHIGDTNPKKKHLSYDQLKVNDTDKCFWEVIGFGDVKELKAWSKSVLAKKYTPKYTKIQGNSHCFILDPYKYVNIYNEIEEVLKSDHDLVKLVSGFKSLNKKTKKVWNPEALMKIRERALSFGQLTKCKDHYILTVYGGNNGWSNVERYVKDLLALVKECKKHFPHVWLHQYQANCSDCHAIRICFDQEPRVSKSQTITKEPVISVTVGNDKKPAVVMGARDFFKKLNENK